MTPELTSIIAAIAMLLLTVSAIVDVALIDLRYSHMRKGRRANILVWMILGGVVLNIPFMWEAGMGFVKLYH